MLPSKPIFATDDSPSLHTVLDKPIKKPTIICPDMVKLGIKHHIMREGECLMRLKENPRCLKECLVVDHIRTKYKIQPANPTVKEKTKWRGDYRPKVTLKCACGLVFTSQSETRKDCMPCIIKNKMKGLTEGKRLNDYKAQLEKAYQCIENAKQRKKRRKW